MSPVMDSHVFSHLFDLILFIALSFISFVLPCLVLSCLVTYVLSYLLHFSYSSLTPLFSFLFSSFLLLYFVRYFLTLIFFSQFKCTVYFLLFFMCTYIKLACLCQMYDVCHFTLLLSILVQVHQANIYLKF